MNGRRPLSRAGRNLVVGFSIVLAAALVVACSHGPTDPDMPGMMLTQPMISVAGQVMNGQTMPVGHGNGASTLFQAHLRYANGQPMTGGMVRVRYERPRGMMMGNSTGQFMLYDDGTHGDDVAGDGIYCFEDWDGRYGCHGAGFMAGEYCYEFWGEDHDGHQSNHREVTVTLR